VGEEIYFKKLGRGRGTKVDSEKKEKKVLEGGISSYLESMGESSTGGVLKNG